MRSLSNFEEETTWPKDRKTKDPFQDLNVRSKERISFLS